MPLGTLIESIFGGDQRAKEVKNQRKEIGKIHREFNKPQWRMNKDRLNADRDWLYDKTKKDESNAKEIAAYQDKINTNRYNDQLAIRSKQIEFADQQFKKSAQLFGQQNEYNQDARNLAIGNVKLNYNDEMKNLAYQERSLGNEFAGFLADSRLTLEEGRSEFQAQGRQNEMGKLGNQIAYQDALRRTQLGGARYQQEFNDQRTEAAFKNQDAIIEALQAQGAVEARGVTGNSAARLAMNAVSALGRNQAAIQNQLLAGSQRLNLQLSELQNQLDTAGRTQKLEDVKLDSELLRARNRFSQTTQRVKDDMFKEGKEYELNKEILLANRGTASQRRDLQIGQIENQLRGAQVQALANLQLPPVDPPMPTAPIPSPIPEFMYPRELEDYDYGPEPIKGSVPDVNPWGPITNGLNAGFQLVTGIAGGLKGPDMQYQQPTNQQYWMNAPSGFSMNNPANFQMNPWGNFNQQPQQMPNPFNFN